ncbi:MAG: DUF2516 family protein [Acidimicrobiia bacterium]
MTTVLADVAPGNVSPVFWVLWAVSIAIGLGILAWNIWAIVDCARRPDYQWAAAGENKTTWLLLLILVGLVLGFGCGITMIIMPILYMAIPRPKLKAVAAGGGQILPGDGGYGFGSGPPGAPPYGGPPPG